IVLLTGDGRICFLNRTGGGSPVEASLGVNVLDMTLPEDRPILAEAMHRALEAGGPVDYEARGGDVQGQPDWVFGRIVRLGGPSESAHLLLIARNITERKQAEQRLRENEERLRQLLDSLPVITWEFDAQAMRFTYVNGRAEAILGYPLEAWYEPH